MKFGTSSHYRVFFKDFYIFWEYNPKENEHETFTDKTLGRVLCTHGNNIDGERLWWLLFE
jgi:hypothetical protein